MEGSILAILGVLSHLGWYPDVVALCCTLICGCLIPLVQCNPKLCFRRAPPVVVASGRTRRLVISCVFCVKWVRWGVSGWVGGDVNVHWTCTLTWCYATARSLQFTRTTWCYATARSLQFTQLRDATLTGVGGWVGGMLTFIGLAHLRDATLLHVRFNLHNYVMLCYCTFASIYTTTWCYVDWGGGVGGWVGGGDVNVHWTYTLTWCYATARSLQFIQLRDATLLHVLFNLHNYVMLCYCTFASIYTTTWCYVDGGWGGGWVGGGC